MLSHQLAVSLTSACRLILNCLLSTLKTPRPSQQCQLACKDIQPLLYWHQSFLQPKICGMNLIQNDICNLPGEAVSTSAPSSFFILDLRGLSLRERLRWAPLFPPPDSSPLVMKSDALGRRPSVCTTRAKNGGMTLTRC